MKTLDTILDDATIALGVLSTTGGLINPAVPGGAALLAKLLAVLQAGVRAHEAIANQPIDLSTLHHIDPV